MRIGNIPNHESAVGQSTPARAAWKAFKHKASPLSAGSPSCIGASRLTAQALARLPVQFGRIPKMDQY